MNGSRTTKLFSQSRKCNDPVRDISKGRNICILQRTAVLGSRRCRSLAAEMEMEIRFANFAYVKLPKCDI